jgi:uncharacterized protein (TIGR00251 family)
MLVKVRVITNAGRNEVLDDSDQLKVRLKAPATKGKANKVLIDVLAKHFHVRKGNVRIVKGERSREKLIEILKD